MAIANSPKKFVGYSEEGEIGVFYSTAALRYWVASAVGRVAVSSKDNACRAILRNLDAEDVSDVEAEE